MAILVITQPIHCWDGDKCFTLTTFRYPESITNYNKKPLAGMQITARGVQSVFFYFLLFLLFFLNIIMFYHFNVIS